MTERKKPAQWRRVHSDIVYSAAVNHLIKGRAEAIVLHHIADRIRGDKAVCYPTHVQLVADTGLPKATLIRAIDSLVASGLLGRHKGTGGRHSVYWLPLPDAIAANLPAEAVALYSKHMAAMKAHLVAEGYVSSVVRAESHAWDHHSLTDGTIRVSSGETHKEEESLEEKPLNRNLPAGADLGMEVKEEKPAIYTLPIASVKERAAWIGRWPADDATLNVRIHEMADPRPRITLAMLDLLGYSAGAVDMDAMAARGAAKAKINERLTDDAVFQFRALSNAGGVRKTALADWLAHNAFAPLSQEVADEKAA